ncbi:hypothetical protein E2C01_097447 [Portunus trituberculatus]|uniref:Uncharacterized protein n=1 Tax=Portunus trituberculatus TaxID=210409 RepID=A0A5B7K9Y7_PORTR|nr:hypothetical protein [Portunus trituberculatus]
MTYPLVQQSAFTNGKQWILSLFQLNTCALHSERPVVNPRNNILWCVAGGVAVCVYVCVCYRVGVGLIVTCFISSFIQLFLQFVHTFCCYNLFTQSFQLFPGLNF